MIKDSRRLYPFIGAILVFALTFVTLYFGDNVGLSDNGDFRRVLLANNIEYADETDYYYLFKQDYTMLIEGDTFWEKASGLTKCNSEEDIYSSPQFVIIKASKLLNFIMNTLLVKEEDSYNIAYLAFIYTLLLSLAAWGIFRFFADESRKLRITVLVLFLFMFCDAGYTLYFNSFYGEPLQYVSLMSLIALGLLIYKRPTIPKIALFFVALYFFAGSKLANVPYAVVISLLALSFSFLRKDKLYKTGVVISVAVAVVFAVNLYVSIPDWMHNDTTYQSVFFGAVKESKTPEKDFKQLGIDEKYLPLINTHAYMDAEEYPLDITTDEFKHDFYDKVSKFDVALFYLRHPIRFARKVGFSIENASCLRPLNCGTHKYISMYYTNRCSMWSNLRVASKILYNPYLVPLIVLLMTAYAVLIHIYLVKNKRQTNEKRFYLINALYVLIAGLWINMCLPVIGNGEADIMKHMFLFANCMDILLAALVMGIVNMQRRNRIITVTAIAATVLCLQIEPPKKTIELGEYNGKPVVWEIMREYDDGTAEVVTKKCIEKRAFDYENNMWETSDLRQWLNSDFIAGFSPRDLAALTPKSNEVMLTYNDRGLAQSGNHTHYWSATVGEVNDLSETAYKYYVDDIVYIPTLEMMEDIDVNGSFWVLCPYGYNDRMQRYMKKDGFVLHTNVDNVQGVRAAARVKLGVANGD